MDRKMSNLSKDLIIKEINDISLEKDALTIIQIQKIINNLKNKLLK